MAKRSEWTLIADDLRKEIRKRHEEVAKAKPVPFGEERVRKSTAEARMAQMPPAETDDAVMDYRVEQIMARMAQMEGQGDA